MTIERRMLSFMAEMEKLALWDSPQEALNGILANSECHLRDRAGELEKGEHRVLSDIAAAARTALKDFPEYPFVEGVAFRKKASTRLLRVPLRTISGASAIDKVVNKGKENPDLMNAHPMNELPQKVERDD